MSVRTMCAVADRELHKQERLIKAKLSRNPRDVRLKSKLQTIRKQIASEKARCAAEAKRERSVRDAEARAEKQQFDSQRRQAREEARMAKLQRKRESFEFRRARKEAGEITGRDVGMYGLAAAGVAGAVGLLYLFG
jgi:hypothetical protein